MSFSLDGNHTPIQRPRPMQTASPPNSHSASDISRWVLHVILNETNVDSLCECFIGSQLYLITSIMTHTLRLPVVGGICIAHSAKLSWRDSWAKRFEDAPRVSCGVTDVIEAEDGAVVSHPHQDSSRGWLYIVAKPVAVGQTFAVSAPLPSDKSRWERWWRHYDQCFQPAGLTTYHCEVNSEIHHKLALV